MVFSTISGLEIQLVIGQRMEAYTWSAYNMVKYLLGLLVESHFSHEFLYISHVHVATLSGYDLSLTLLIYTQFIYPGSSEPQNTCLSRLQLPLLF